MDDGAETSQGSSRPGTQRFAIEKKARVFAQLWIATCVLCLSTIQTAIASQSQITVVTVNSITSSSAIVIWTTNSRSTSIVQYGLTSSYGTKIKVRKSKVTDHAVTLTGLTANTLYHFRVKSKDSYHNTAISADLTFQTGPPLVFPGAVGFGVDTPAGRGGAILKVTNLNDSGPGSFRDALQTTGPRIVVFEVSGEIQLLSELKIRNPYLTVAGQTAPSPGITIRAGEFNVNTHDVLIQHIRIRVGDQLPAGTDPESLDGISADGPGSYNVIMDHVSVSWGIDENASSWGDSVHDITFSNCIVSEALHNSVHPKGMHSMGMLITPNARNVAIVGNLLAHDADRNPLISNGASVVIANNVFYNWMGGRATNIGNPSDTIPARYPTQVSVVNNVYIGGTNTTSSTYAISAGVALLPGAQIYYQNNLLENVFAEFRNQAPFDPVVPTPPIMMSNYTPLTTADVESSVLAHSGSRPMDRDDPDHRVVNDVLLRTGQIIDSQSQVGGWPPLPVNLRALTIPANPNGDDDGDGYTNLEEQLLFPMAQALEGQ